MSQRALLALANCNILSVATNITDAVAPAVRLTRPLLVARVLCRPRRDPWRPAHRCVPGAGGAVPHKVAVVRVGEADVVGRRRLCGVAALLLQVEVVPRGAVGGALAPNDQVDALARRDVVGAVPPPAEVHEAVADSVRVPVGEVAVGRVAHVSTHREAGALKVATKAYVEGHVAVIRVHVEPEVLAGGVLDDEGVVPVEAAAFAREARPCDRLQHRLEERVEQRLHPDLVEHEAVLVHRVGPGRLEPGGEVAVHLAALIRRGA
mmetsp:Transcript_4827/g.15938  ORF Transcript_4827/g.15938 Transcript_4827/m.15938 type:complete len:264 (-) Transcript_4827:389-1180(-)